MKVDSLVMNIETIQANIKEGFLSVFPSSFVTINKHALGDGFAAHFALGKNKNEWANGIIHNDPMACTLHFWPDERKIEIKCSITIKPQEKHLYCSHIKINKKTILVEKANTLEFLKYFSNIRTKIIDNLDSIMDCDKELVVSKICGNL